VQKHFFALIAAALPLALSTAPASAADEPANGATPPAAKEKTVCRRVSDTGSILPKRVCMSASEWAAMDKQREQTDDRASGRKMDSSTSMISGGANIGR
jgi:hypothetical protein